MFSYSKAQRNKIKKMLLQSDLSILNPFWKKRVIFNFDLLSLEFKISMYKTLILNSGFCTLLNMEYYWKCISPIGEKSTTEHNFRSDFCLRDKDRVWSKFFFPSGRYWSIPRASTMTAPSGTQLVSCLCRLALWDCFGRHTCSHFRGWPPLWESVDFSQLSRRL